MSFKILVGDKGNVDFNTPILVTSDEKEKFLLLMKSLFDPNVVQEENVEEFRDWRIGGDRIQYPRKWTAEEYEVLLNSHSIEEAINKLGRSGMAILVQDGIWRPEFISWCNKKGKTYISENSIDLIKEFMKEKQDKILYKRNKKKELSRRLREKEKEIMELKEELNQWSSDKKRNEIEFFMNMGKIPKEDINWYIKKHKKRVQDEIENLEREIALVKTK